MFSLSRAIPTLFRRAAIPTFTRNFGVELSIHSVADDDTYEVEVDKGKTILEVCQEEGVDITAVCAGGGSCGSCHIVLPQDIFDQVPPPNDMEKELLTNVVFGVQPTSRLACRVKIDEKFAGKTIEVPLPL